MNEHFDVIVVGAGLSGIGAAVELKARCPNKSFAVLEARESIGGTWDLFRYPGIRSDSDMFTLGYRGKPWTGHKSVADGASILEYIREAAREHDIPAKVRFGHRVVRAAWSSERAVWALEVEVGTERAPARITCNMLHVCSGYYAYDAGYTPDFAGKDTFAGRIVHAQQWSDDIDYADKRVVVIGSGATAMTLVPELAKKAAHVVMLQRSPTYVVSSPAVDRMANFLRKLLPAGLAYAITRWRNVLFSILFFNIVRRWPALAKRKILERVQEALGPGYDVAKHFTPRYNVWDQRLCLVPDNDLFDAINAERVSVVTDHIESFTQDGIVLRSGQRLAADLVVAATGLQLVFLGGMQLAVDGRHIEPNSIMNYKGCMFSDVPNLVYTFGYTNASWTLKADLTAEFLCRLVRHLDATGSACCVPRRKDPSIEPQPWLDFSSGYVTRTLARFPTQGSKRPFRLYQNYVLDLFMLRYGALEDGTLEFAAERTSRAAFDSSERSAEKLSS